MVNKRKNCGKGMAVASNGPTIAVSLIKHGFLLRATRWPPVEEPSRVIYDQPIFSNTEKVTYHDLFAKMALFWCGESKFGHCG